MHIYKQTILAILATVGVMIAGGFGISKIQPPVAEDYAVTVQAIGPGEDIFETTNEGTAYEETHFVTDTYIISYEHGGRVPLVCSPYDHVQPGSTVYCQYNAGNSYYAYADPDTFNLVHQNTTNHTKKTWAILGGILVVSAGAVATIAGFEEDSIDAYIAKKHKEERKAKAEEVKEQAKLDANPYLKWQTELRKYRDDLGKAMPELENKELKQIIDQIIQALDDILEYTDETEYKQESMMKLVNQFLPMTQKLMVCYLSLESVKHPTNKVKNKKTELFAHFKQELDAYLAIKEDAFATETSEAESTMNVFDKCQQLALPAQSGTLTF